MSVIDNIGILIDDDEGGIAAYVVLLGNQSFLIEKYGEIGLILLDKALDLLWAFADVNTVYGPAAGAGAIRETVDFGHGLFAVPAPSGEKEQSRGCLDCRDLTVSPGQAEDGGATVTA